MSSACHKPYIAANLAEIVRACLGLQSKGVVVPTTFLDGRLTRHDPHGLPANAPNRVNFLDNDENSKTT